MAVVDRMLFPDEWHRLDEAVKRIFGQDKEPPAAEMCMGCAIREEDGVIIGVLFLQLIPHLEPFGSAGGVSFSALKSVIDQFIVTSVGSIGYFAHFIDNPVGENVAISNGFKPIGMLYFGKPTTN